LSREAGPLTLAAARTQVAIKVDYRGQILSLEQTDLGERTDLVIRGRRGGVKARISLGIRELDELLVAAGAARGRALAQRQNLEILERRDY
jgi:allophanate hydrolase subunit 2